MDEIRVPAEGPVKTRRVTSADVARAAGVSRATVSYVLNDAPERNISAATRELVRSTAARLGHMPYAPARALRSGSSNTVLVLVPSFAIGYVFDRSLEMLNSALAERGFALLAHHHSAQVRPLAELWRLVTPTLVVAMSELSAADRASLKSSQAPVVDVDGIVSFAMIGRMQAEYLISRGHRSLGFTRPTDPHIASFARAQLGGIRAACRAARLPAPAVAEMDLTEASGVRVLAGWRDRRKPVTGICAHNDNYGLMLLAGMRASALRPGEDMAVIGVDDIPMASLGLTTIAVDIEVFGTGIIRSVLAALHEPQQPATEQEMLHLVVRESA